MTSIEIAQQYFELSNRSDFDKIKLLFTETSTYRSGSSELFLGVKDIMAMQRSYHESFVSLMWQIKAINEIKPGIILIEFSFKGKTKTGEIVVYSGLESIIFYDKKIQHIDVCRKQS